MTVKPVMAINSANQMAARLRRQGVEGLEISGAADIAFTREVSAGRSRTASVRLNELRNYTPHPPDRQPKLTYYGASSRPIVICQGLVIWYNVYTCHPSSIGRATAS